MTNIKNILAVDIENIANLKRKELDQIGKMMGIKGIHLGGQSTAVSRIEAKYYKTMAEELNNNAVNAPAETSKEEIPFAVTEEVNTRTTQERTANQPDVLTIEQPRDDADRERDGEVTSISGIYMPGESTPLEREQEHIREAMKLRRVRIQMLNPLKAELKGEIFTLHDRTLGTLRKHIPYGTKYYVNGYHIEQAFYDHLKERQYNSYTEEERTILGAQQMIPVGELLPEFEITDLPPLTLEELRELALKQEQSKRIDAD